MGFLVWVHRPRNWVQRNGWCPRVDAMASELSPRKIRLATGSLRRSFFTLGRLLALASRQQSMALLPRNAGRREQERGTQPLLPDQRSDPGWPHQESCRSAAPPRRLGQPRGARSEAESATRYTHRADPPLQPGLGPPSGRLLGRSKEWDLCPVQAQEPSSEGPQGRKRVAGKDRAEWTPKTP